MATTAYVYVSKTTTTPAVPATATGPAVAATTSMAYLADETQLGIRDMINGKFSLTATVDRAEKIARILATMPAVASKPAVAGVAEVLGKDGKIVTPAVAPQDAVVGSMENVTYTVVLSKNKDAMPHMVKSAIDMKAWATEWIVAQDAVRKALPALLREREEDTTSTTTTRGEKPQF